MRAATRPLPFSEAIFFHLKLENIKFIHVSNMRDLTLFIEQDVSDKNRVFFLNFSF